MNDKTDSYDVTAEADQAHDDKWLADQIVALGVGEHVSFCGVPDIRYAIGEGRGTYASDFVRDWRVAGALMEKHGNLAIRRKYAAFVNGRATKIKHWLVMDLDCEIEVRNVESLPRAINEACVEVLE